MILLEGAHLQVTFLHRLDTAHRRKGAWNGCTVRNVQGQSRAPEGVGIGAGTFPRHRVDHELNIPLQHAIHHVWRPFIDFVNGLYDQTGPGNRRCRPPATKAAAQRRLAKLKKLAER